MIVSEIKNEFATVRIHNEYDRQETQQTMEEIGRIVSQASEAIQKNDVMYWNCKRIYDDLDNWVVFIKEKDGKPQGAIYYVDAANGWFEIFGIDIDRGIYTD